MKPIIIVLPTQGLCNRLRALASAYILAQHLNSTLYVNWIPEPCCNCHLTDIITNPFNSFDIKCISSSDTVLFKPDIHTNNLIDQFHAYKYVIIQGGHEFKHHEMPILSFIQKKHNFYSSLKYSNEVENILTKCDNINNCIGVHYRDFIPQYDEQDGRVFNEVSPIQNFITTLKNLHSKEPHTKFFISSNSNFAYDNIKNIIPNENIIYLHNIDTNRNTPLGIIHAFVSLILLSRTSFIIGTTMSSFSDEACFFNKISKLCIGDEEVKSYHCYGFNQVFDYNMILPNYKILDRIHN
jgi:hypothetical protein